MMGSHPKVSETRPNVLFIVGESHAPGLLGAQQNTHVKTPNLDRLASRGALFENAYCASPLCVPARASIATGRFPHESGFWESSMAFDGSCDSWMSRLRGSGYETVGIGKMHFRSDDDDNGFTRVIDTMHIADGRGDLVGALRYCGAEPPTPGLWEIWTKRYGTDAHNPYRQFDEGIAFEAAKWLGGEAPALNRPWALAVHFIAAHAPFVTPPGYQELYDASTVPPPIQFAKGERPRHPSVEHLRKLVTHDEEFSLEETCKVRAAYYATVTYLDALIGRVLDTLEEQGLTENTLIIYTSDHGFSVGDHFLFGLFHMYEEALKVPLLIAGPGIAKSSRLSCPVSHTDLYPTVLSACGVPQNDAEQALIGRSLWPVIHGEETERSLFAEYHGCCTRSGGFVLRDGAYKLIHFVDMEPQLFDLNEDPEEARNLASMPEFAPILGRLTALLLELVDPVQVDARAKDDQRKLIERHGGKEAVLEEMDGFAYSPPPGLSWQSMVEFED